MTIKRFVWTEHALLRLDQRHLTRIDVERTIREGHGERVANDGRAAWLLAGLTAYGVPFETIYDHPAGGDDSVARVVSAWRLDQTG